MDDYVKLVKHAVNDDMELAFDLFAKNKITELAILIKDYKRQIEDIKNRLSRAEKDYDYLTREELEKMFMKSHNENVGEPAYKFYLRKVMNN